MAVDATKNPIIVASADAGTTDILTTVVDVSGVRWVGATTNAHTAVIQDSAARVVWASQAATATLGTPSESTVRFRCGGLRVPTLASGTLYIYLRDGDR